jgi:hypothetical protein
MDKPLGNIVKRFGRMPYGFVKVHIRFVEQAQSASCRRRALAPSHPTHVRSSWAISLISSRSL